MTENDQHNSKARIRLALETAQMVVWDWDIDTGAVLHSENGVIVWGRKITHSADVEKLIHPDDLEFCRSKIQEVIDTGRSNLTEFRIIRSDTGEVQWVQDRAYAKEWKDGKITSLTGITINIQERKRNEEALRLSDERFNSLAEAIPQVVWISEAGGKGVYFNQYWYDYTGIPVNVIDDQFAIDVVHPEDLPKVFQIWGEAMSAGEVFETELRLRRKDGKYHWFSSRSIPIKDSQGRIIKRFGTTINIHSSKIAQLRAENLRAMNRSLTKASEVEEVTRVIVDMGRLAVGAAAAGIFVLDEQTKLLKISEYTGYSEEQIQKYSSFPLSSNVPVAKCIRERIPVFFHCRKDWEQAFSNMHLSSNYFAWAAVPMFEDSKVFGAIGFSFSDPQEFGTEQRALLQIVMDECSQALTRAQLSKRQRLFSEKIQDLQLISFHLSSAITQKDVLDVIEKEVFKVFHSTAGVMAIRSPESNTFQILAASGYDIGRWKKLLDGESLLISDTYNRGEPIFLESQSEILNQCQTVASYLSVNQTGNNLWNDIWDGTRSLAVFPMVLNGVKFGVITLAYKDDTRFCEDTRKMMKNLIAQCSEAFERAKLYDLSQYGLRARDTLISVSSHELLTPVTSMKLQMQILNRQRQKEGAISQSAIEKMIAHNTRQLDRLQKLINDMLDLSRINSGKLTIKLQDTDLSTLVTNTIAHFDEAVVLASCSLSSDIEPNIYGKWDHCRIEQVVTNLLSNACRYARGKAIKVALKKESQKAKLIVEDSGIGIAKEDQVRIFQRFERATSICEGSGMGIGLFLVQQIVEAHRGSVAVESELGKGSKFIVNLPCSLLQSEISSEIDI